MAPAPIRVVAPATGALLAEVPDEGPEGVAAAIEAARAAAPAWGARSLTERVQALKTWRDGVIDEAAAVAGTLVAESGKPRHEAEAIEILYLCELIRFSCRAARRALSEETRNPFLFLTKKTRLLRKPLGVVGVIGPWNFPILNNAADGVGPLLMGNTVVLKPSEVTPLTSLLLRDLWIKAGNPPDVLRVVTGRGETTAALVDRADGIMFTGSVATGRKVAARAGERLIPCVTELGGKSPFVVLTGADLPRAAEGGTRPRDLPGQFFPPTVLLGATQDMDVMKEETFGPLVPVMRVKDEEEALRLANDSHLGLNATVFGPQKRAAAFARRLQSGQAIVNDVLVNYFVVESPLGGWKSSGLGVRHGVESLRQWTRIEAVTEGRPLLAPIERLAVKKLAFPYDTRFLALIRRATRLLYRRGISAKLRRPS